MVSLVRDGRLVWPYCVECGCRLDFRVMDEWTWLMHYGRGLVDPRGHMCNKILETAWVETDSIYQGVV